MARLQDARGRVFPVGAHHLIGRSRAMHTVLRSADVSAQHLAITWDGACWSVRDLASRNGTWLDGRRLATGEVAPLARGSVLQLGGPAEQLTLIDDAPPAPRAESGEIVLEGGADLLAIPSPENPVAVVLFDPELGWRVSVGDADAAARDGQVITVEGVPWRLTLPQALDRTLEARREPAQPADLGLHFYVSSDEEYVEITVRHGQATHRLPARAHHYLLLTLARARLRDSEEPEARQGWVHTADLLKMLRLSSNQLYVSLHRARKELDAIGVPADIELVERRPTTRQLRIGARDLRVDAL